MLNKMRKTLAIHTYLDVPFGIKMVLLLLFVAPSMAFATIATPEVAVPLTTSPKVDPVRKQSRYTSTTNYAPTVSYSTAAKGNYNPLRTVSSGTVRSWNAGSLQSAASGGNAVVSATSSSTVTSTSLSVPQVGVSRKKVYASTFGAQTAVTKRRAQGGSEWGEEEGGGETNLPGAPTDPSLGDLWQYDGTWYIWNGLGWEVADEGDLPQDTPTPIGDVPFFLMVILLVAYAGAKRLKSRPSVSADVR